MKQRFTNTQIPGFSTGPCAEHLAFYLAAQLTAKRMLRVSNGYSPSTSPLLFLKVKNPCFKHM